MATCLASPAGGGATLPACATPRSQRARQLEAMRPRWTGCVSRGVQAALPLGYVPCLCGGVVVLSCCVVLCLEAFVRDGRARGGRWVVKKTLTLP